MALPLDGRVTPLGIVDVATGTYGRVQFKVEDLEDDEEDDGSVAQALRVEILAAFPDWPETASLLINGSFTNLDDQTFPFRVYAEAEIEVEVQLDPPLVVADDGVANRDIVIDVLPQTWFSLDGDRVIDLSLYDYDATGELLRLRIEDGFGDDHANEGEG